VTINCFLGFESKQNEVVVTQSSVLFWNFLEGTDRTTKSPSKYVLVTLTEDCKSPSLIETAAP